jgi:hypothetical protein
MKWPYTSSGFATISVALARVKWLDALPTRVNDLAFAGTA